MLGLGWILRPQMVSGPNTLRAMPLVKSILQRALPKLSSVRIH
jgi:hypothetical protein